ncbi:MAG: cytochrome-c peroxidase [Janthinobacterium lividum]
MPTSDRRDHRPAPARPPSRPRAPARWRRGVLPALALAAALGIAPARAQLPSPADEPITPVPTPPTLDPARVALGAALFSDTDLSGPRTRSCASCHDLATNGADARRFDPGLDGTQIPVNTNTVFNAALSFRLNWSGDARTLQAQADESLRSIAFMAADEAQVIGRLRDNHAMAARFASAYGHGPDWPSVLDALATFERTLVTPGSRFDRWLGGERTALGAEELDGYHLFKSIGCASCHQGVNIGGNLFERFGVVDPRGGRDSRVFRVPSLRNVATSPPYFDDGSAPTLQAAVGRMASAQLGRDLSAQEVASIVAFLGTLTGRYAGHDVTAPQ